MDPARFLLFEGPNKAGKNPSRLGLLWMAGSGQLPGSLDCCYRLGRWGGALHTWTAHSGDRFLGQVSALLPLTDHLLNLIGVPGVKPGQLPSPRA